MATFAASCAWNGETICDGHTAEDRAQWVVANCGLAIDAARQRVMGEFPARFSVDPPAEASGVWSGETICDGHTAEDRAQWVVANCGLAIDAARQRVMGEFPARFGGLAAEGLGGGAVRAATELVPVADADPALLVWADEFDYDGPPDPAKWRYDLGGHGWGNRESAGLRARARALCVSPLSRCARSRARPSTGELQCYTDSEKNARVTDGVLWVRAVREAPSAAGGRAFSSARIVTKGLGDWRYGRVQARVRLRGCRARGCWSAVWMLPTEDAFGPWPRSGEIDVMEMVGFDPGRVHGTAHTERFNHTRGTQVGGAVAVAEEDWHVFEVIWSSTAIQFVADGRRYHQFEKAASAGWEAWPFDRPFHLILNLAVGGDWGGQRGVDEDAFSGEGQVMEVAWVRVYGCPGAAF